MAQEVHEPPKIEPSEVFGMPIEAGNMWGPFPTDLHAGDKCYVVIAKKPHNYHGLPPEVLVGIDFEEKVRFITDIPKIVDSALRVYEKRQVLTEEQMQEQSRSGRIIEDKFKAIVKTLCR